MAKVVLISACLAGIACRYDGGFKPIPDLCEKLSACRLIPFCPETLGGLPVPRPPAEIVGQGGAAVWEGKAHVMDQNSRDCTLEFIRGAEAVRALVLQWQPSLVIFKAHSPSCGVGSIHDGSFSRKLRDGDGVTAALLRTMNITMITEKEFLADMEQILARL
jgi:uncharacterized protein YbbK (DUF523 family)